MAEQPSHLSIDVGGTKIHAAIYDPQFKPTEQFTLETANFFGQRRGLKDLHLLFEALKSKLPPQNLYKNLGVSINCAMHQNRVMYSTLLNGGVGIDLQDVSSQYFDFENFRAENDVVSMVRAELKMGRGQNCPSFLFVNLGMGMKGIYVEDGHIIIGGHGSAGEISQEGVWVEELNRYVKSFDLSSGRGVNYLAKEITGQDIAAKEVFAEKKQEVIDMFTKYLARYLYNASLYYNPSLIVFGGSLTLSAPLWLEKAKGLYYASHELKFLLADDLIISDLENPASLGVILPD